MGKPILMTPASELEARPRSTAGNFESARLGQMMVEEERGEEIAGGKPNSHADRPWPNRTSFRARPLGGVARQENSSAARRPLRGLFTIPSNETTSGGAEASHLALVG